MGRKIKIEIKSWMSGEVLFSYESEGNTLQKTVNEANLRGANLRGADLYGADLYEANLRGADLRGANLRGANLYEANLYEANLRGANLRGANLYEADLRGANLYEADLRGANLYEADLRGANLYEANLRGADLRGQTIERLPRTFVEECSRDILFILEHLKPEVPALKAKLLAGEVDGSQYEGECACLVGSLAIAKQDSVENVCKAIPYYTRGLHNPGERWFLNIKRGDTPADNAFAAHAVALCNMVLGLPEDDGLDAVKAAA